MEKYFVKIFRFFHLCLLSFLPLTILFLSCHLLVHNLKKVHIPLLWLLSVLLAVPTIFSTDILPSSQDPYRTEFQWRPVNSSVCTTTSPNLDLVFSLTTFILPTILLLIPSAFLFLQSAGVAARRLESHDRSLSLITFCLIPVFVVSRAPAELFNLQLLVNWRTEVFGDFYVALMKYAVFAPAMIHPLLYFTLSSDTNRSGDHRRAASGEQELDNLDEDGEEVVMTNIAGDLLDREEYCQLVSLGLSRPSVMEWMRLVAGSMFDSFARARTSADKLRSVAEAMDIIQDVTDNREKDIADNIERLRAALAPAEMPHIERWTVSQDDLVHQDCLTSHCQLPSGGLRLLDEAQVCFYSSALVSPSL